MRLLRRPAVARSPCLDFPFHRPIRLLTLMRSPRLPRQGLIFPMIAQNLTSRENRKVGLCTIDAGEVGLYDASGVHDHASARSSDSPRELTAAARVDACDNGRPACYDWAPLCGPSVHPFRMWTARRLHANSSIDRSINQSSRRFRTQAGRNGSCVIGVRRDAWRRSAGCRALGCGRDRVAASGCESDVSSSTGTTGTSPAVRRPLRTAGGAPAAQRRPGKPPMATKTPRSRGSHAVVHPGRDEQADRVEPVPVRRDRQGSRASTSSTFRA